MRRFVILTLWLAVSCGLLAQDDEATTRSGVSLSSQRIVRGVKRSGAGASGMFQLARETWQLGGELIQPIDRDEPTEGAVKAAYAWRSGKNFRFEAFAAPRWYSRVSAGVAKNTWETGMAATWTQPSGWVIELTAFHDFRLQANTVQITVNYSLPLKKLGAYLEWSASVGMSSARDLLPAISGPSVRDSYGYYSTSLRLPYRIGSHTTLVAGCQLAGTGGQNWFWSPIGAPGKVRASFDLGLSFDF